MGEPITIYDKNGKESTVYGKAQLEVEIKGGKTLENPKARKPTTAKK
ncbi:MAG: hypothetical protein GY927_03910 [bacterium]|nr:hypothetical protein [bacterium]